jgi:SsrA-binding protein
MSPLPHQPAETFRAEPATISLLIKLTVMAKSSKKHGKPDNTIATNRKAFHNYHVEDTLIAGISLTGSEVKSLRQKEVSMGEAFVKIANGEAFLYGLYIKPYEQAGYAQHDPLRVRKLLLNRREINKLAGQIQLQGVSVVPISLFFGGPWVKVKLGIGKGKKQHDKRADIAKRDQQRDAQRALKQF